MIMKLISFGVVTFDGVGVTIYKFDRIIPPFLPYLPIPTRSRNAGIRPKCLAPKCSRKNVNECDVCSVNPTCSKSYMFKRNEKLTSIEIST